MESERRTIEVFCSFCQNSSFRCHEVPFSVSPALTKAWDLTLLMNRNIDPENTLEEKNNRFPETVTENIFFGDNVIEQKVNSITQW